MTVYLPGDKIEQPSSSNVSIVGYGINVNDEKLVANQPGALRTADNKIWLNVHSKRYIPNEGDRVIGIVVSKIGDFFRLDIGTAELAVINFTNFEGATKRNRPNLKTGDIIYAQVFDTTPRTEAELTCVDDEKKARGMGQLNNGFMFKVSLNYARRILHPSCQILKTMGKFFKFEITVGLNGRIWINADTNDEIIRIYNIIIQAEHVTGDELIELVKDLYSKSSVAKMEE
ncbi:unnamed protein product [Caenorhabditis bovis]|uniref:Exosome complex component RRP40 n=1 Tax=Caenorhabditis bovis TaxID=2654633 RepID=A0A8S1EVQ1_9PELO|nr:unnamed protein product [Caenorhabditis bovis]